LYDQSIEITNFSTISFGNSDNYLTISGSYTTDLSIVAGVTLYIQSYCLTINGIIGFSVVCDTFSTPHTATDELEVIAFSSAQTTHSNLYSFRGSPPTEPIVFFQYIIRN